MSDDLLLILPLILPLLGGVVTVLFSRVNQLKSERVTSMVTMVLLTIVSLIIFRRVWVDGIVVAEMAGWQAPYGIVLVADIFSAVMLVMTAVVSLSVVVYSTVNIDRQRVAIGYYPLVNFLVMGICGAFLTGDLFNLYVWFEVLLIASFVLLGLGGGAAQLSGTVKYVIINLVSSTIFLTALGLTYGLAGTLNMAQVAVRLGEVAQTNAGVVTMLGMLYLIAFGIKSALFPLYFWLPASYHTPPISVSAIFAGLLTKVGVYALMRVFTLIFIHDIGFTTPLFLWIAGLTMVFGVFGAMSQMDFRRILSVHIVSQVGYMMMGLGLASQSSLALAGGILAIVHNGVVKSNLFLIAGIADWVRGTFDLKKLGGLLETRPYLAAMFFLAAMSLAGLPPLSGFWPKFMLVRGGLEVGQIGIVLVSLGVSLLTMYSMTKIWIYAFWHEAPESQYRPIDYSRLELVVHLVPVTFLVVVMLAIGFGAEGMTRVVVAAAEQLLAREPYIVAVLGGG